MSQTKKDRLSTYQIAFRDHYKKKKRLAMGLGRRQEWNRWHSEEIQDPTASSTFRKESLGALDEKSSAGSATARFSRTSFGLDARGVPLVDNKSGLGLGLGLHSGARASLEHFQQAKHAELLRYDPSISKFVQGNGSDSQRASPIYNSTRVHTSARSSAKREQELFTDAGPVFGGSRLTTHRIGSESARQHLFPRHPGDSQPLQRPGSINSHQPLNTSSTLAQLGALGATMPRNGFQDFVPQTGGRLPPIVPTQRNYALQ